MEPNWKELSKSYDSATLTEFQKLYALKGNASRAADRKRLRTAGHISLPFNMNPKRD